VGSWAHPWLPAHHLHHIGSRGWLRFWDSKLTAKINSSSWVCLSSFLLRGSGAATAPQAPAASSTLNSSDSCCHPKPCSFHPVPSHLPRAGPLPMLDEAAAAARSITESVGLRCCLCWPVLPALAPAARAGATVQSQMGPSERGAGLPAVPMNQLGLKQLLGKRQRFRAGRKYLHGASAVRMSGAVCYIVYIYIYI